MYIEINPSKFDFGIFDSGLYSGCTIINKDKDFNNIVFGKLLASYKPSLEIIPTYSLGVNYHKDLVTSFKIFEQYCMELPSNFTDILLVSGNPKRKLDTTKALQILQQSKFKPKFGIGVAFNPYSKNIEEEKDNLQSKISTGFVTSIWLQLGEDIEVLKYSIKWLQMSFPNVKVIGSVLSPSKSLLAKLAFRPWHGVFYSPKYYSDVEYAQSNSKLQKQILTDHGCQILVSGI
jgi:hypothetical protein